MPAITALGGQRQKDCDEFQARQDYTARPSLKTTQNTKHGHSSRPNSSRYNYFWKTKHNYVKKQLSRAGFYMAFISTLYFSLLFKVWRAKMEKEIGKP